jgi:hypothetical protein
VLGQPFYHRTIRKIVVAFGTLFNNVKIVRHNKNFTEQRERILVPLSYGAKEKYLTRIVNNLDLQKAVSIVVPRISFEMTGISYDPSRKQISTIRNFSKSNTSSQKINTQFVPVPYNFDFSMSIFVRNTEDGTQILEQILPYFTPDFNVTVDFIPEMNQKYDLPITLNSVNSTVDYEGDMLTTRLITWDLEFTAKSYIWPSVSLGNVIRKANTNIFISENPQEYETSANGIITEIKTTPNPIDANIDDEFGFSELFSDPNKPPAILLVTEDGFEIITEDSRFNIETS